MARCIERVTRTRTDTIPMEVFRLFGKSRICGKDVFRWMVGGLLGFLGELATRCARTFLKGRRAASPCRTATEKDETLYRGKQLRRARRSAALPGRPVRGSFDVHSLVL